MPRIRTIKPEFWNDVKVARLSMAARLLFIGTWNWACDRGHLPDDPEDIAFKVLPRDDIVAEKLVQELVEGGFLERLETAESRPYLRIRKFTDHQKIDPRWNSRCPFCDTPQPPETPRTTASRTETPRTTPQDRKGTEGIGEELALNPTSTAVDTRDPPYGFENFWEAYPPRNGKKLEKAKAAAQWQRLKPGEKVAALHGAKHYAQACNAGATIAKDAFRWLRDRAFVDWQTPAATNGRNGEPTPDDWRRLADELERNGQ